MLLPRKGPKPPHGEEPVPSSVTNEPSEGGRPPGPGQGHSPRRVLLCTALPLPKTTSGAESIWPGRALAHGLQGSGGIPETPKLVPAGSRGCAFGSGRVLNQALLPPGGRRSDNLGLLRSSPGAKLAWSAGRGAWYGQASRGLAPELPGEVPQLVMQGVATGTPV